mmetsp:Transcript_14940/g.34199  ORF Transcript_14940/g.34199 Transcript_14940/m.34199 type:complete len:231 (-) Transcript_14940:428-1120(-)
MLARRLCARVTTPGFVPNVLARPFAVPRRRLAAHRRVAPSICSYQRRGLVRPLLRRWPQHKVPTTPWSRAATTASAAAASSVTRESHAPFVQAVHKKRSREPWLPAAIETFVQTPPATTRAARSCCSPQRAPVVTPLGALSRPPAAAGRELPRARLDAARPERLPVPCAASRQPTPALPEERPWLGCGQLRASPARSVAARWAGSRARHRPKDSDRKCRSSCHPTWPEPC